MRALLLTVLILLSTFVWPADVEVTMTPPTTDYVTGEPIEAGTLWGATIVWNRLDTSKDTCWETLLPITDVLLYTQERETLEDACWNQSVIKGEDTFSDEPNPTMTSYIISDLEFGVIRAYRVSWQYKATATDSAGDQALGRRQTGRHWTPTRLFAPATAAQTQPGMTVISVRRVD